MTNFNHERLTIAIGATRQSRVALSAAMEYVLKREAFGKPLIDQPVVRHRLAKAGALLESQWAWVEQFVYQMTKLPKATADIELGGLTAMVKAQSGIVLNECAQCAQLLFGGNGYTKSGQGELVESKCCQNRLTACHHIADDCARNLPRSPGNSHPRWLRGCHAGSRCAAARQELQEQNEGAGEAAGVIEAVG
jgi:alkylation response protein AidB-like acyl-CoA dehydrogenase